MPICGQFATKVGDRQIMAIVKSNAYGHGLAGVSRYLVTQGVEWFGVNSLDEALALRQAGTPGKVLILSYVDPDDFEEVLRQDFRLTVWSIEQIEALEKLAKKIGKKPKVHLKVETGLNRLGFPVDEAIEACKKMSWVINLEGVYTHLASSDSDKNYTKWQIKQFEKFLKATKVAAPNVIVHAANTGAIFNRPESYFDMVRPGIGLYGFTVSGVHPELKPALTWKSKIISVKVIKKGEKVGYGLTFTAKRDSKIAVVGVGYGEGYDRGFSNRGEMLVSGVRCPVIGRIAMSMTIIDVTAVPAEDLAIGKEVVVMGKSGDNEITAFEFAKLIDTNVHEIFTRLPAHLPRVYIN